VHASKASLLLLNKADLLPPHVRAAWADFFDAVGSAARCRDVYRQHP
jgi:large subunit GTPase 1